MGLRKPDMSGFRMVDHVGIWNGVRISNGRPFCQLPFENRTKMSGFRLVFVICHSESDPQNVRFSNDSGFRMVGFLIPTVVGPVRQPVEMPKLELMLSVVIPGRSLAPVWPKSAVS